MAEKIKDLTLSKLEEELSGFYGTENYYKGGPLFPRFLFTDGVKHMAEVAGAFWLIDLVFSHQINKKVKGAGFQIWTLDVNADKSAIATCKEDTNQPVIAQQELEYTDFPAGSFKLYFIDNVLLLPSEY